MKIAKHALDIASVDRSEVGELIAFHNSQYGADRGPDDWFWQYGGYEQDRAVFTVSRDAGRLIATQAMMPVYLNVGGRRVLTGKSENTLLLPEYRGTEVMRELYEYAVEQCRTRDIAFLWGFTRAVKAFRRFGFSTFPLPQQHALSGLNPSMVWRRMRREAGSLFRQGNLAVRLAIDYLRALTSLRATRGEKSGPLQVNRERIDHGQIRQLMQTLQRNHPDLISMDCDEPYLTWRIQKHPRLHYHHYQVTGDGALLAYAFAVRVNGTVSISDMASSAGSAGRLLLGAIIRDHAGQAGQFTALVNPECAVGQNNLQCLRDCGFSPQGTWNLVLRDLSDGKHPQIWDATNWHVTGLWTEGYTM